MLDRPRGHQPDRDTSLSIIRYTRERMASHKRVRRIAFSELPKAVSDKIRRGRIAACRGGKT
jgi:acetyl-CoA synthetase